jgi:hypothetical protein
MRIAYTGVPLYVRTCPLDTCSKCFTENLSDEVLKFVADGLTIVGVED